MNMMQGTINDRGDQGWVGAPWVGSHWVGPVLLCYLPPAKVAGYTVPYI